MSYMYLEATGSQSFYANTDRQTLFIFCARCIAGHSRFHLIMVRCDPYMCSFSWFRIDVNTPMIVRNSISLLHHQGTQHKYNTKTAKQSTQHSTIIRYQGKLAAVGGISVSSLFPLCAVAVDSVDLSYVLQKMWQK